MGHLFILDRETGKPLFPVEERAVPQSDIPGEETWPTQPFPQQSLVYAQQSFTEEDITDLNTEATEKIREQIKNMRLGNLFIPPSMQGSIAMPQFNGGTDWGGATFNPTNNTLIVNTSNEAEWISSQHKTLGGPESH